MATTGKTLLDFLPFWHDQLQQWSLDGRLSAAAREALLLKEDPQALKVLVSQWSFVDFEDCLMISRKLFGATFACYALTNKAISKSSPYFGQSNASSWTSDNIEALRS